LYENEERERERERKREDDFRRIRVVWALIMVEKRRE
jgi:hypothetical protein